MKVAQKAPAGAFLHYFLAAISNHLSEKPNILCFIWSLNTGLTVFPDPDFNPKEAKKMEEALKKMEKKEKRTLRGTVKAVSLAQRLSPKAQRKKDVILNSTAQLKV